MEEKQLTRREVLKAGALATLAGALPLVGPPAEAAKAARDGKPMKVKDLRERIHQEWHKVSQFVHWEQTNDHIITGDPEAEVMGIAVSWMSTFANLQRALDLGCNVFITHEAFYAVKIDEQGKVRDEGFSRDGVIVNNQMLGVAHGLTLEKRDAWVRKRKWVEEKGLAIFRCHDFWDYYPEKGVIDAWATWLGFTGKPVASMDSYVVHDVSCMTFGELAQQVLKRVKPLGQTVIHTIGDPKQKIFRVATGKGASTEYRKMFYGVGGDVLIIVHDDIFSLCESGQWALDMDVPMIIVDHATAEEPGIINLAAYIKEQFPQVKVEHIPCGCIYRAMT
jgi:putative NIF3 family GTP cyclohydrolase 1 type 2